MNTLFTARFSRFLAVVTLIASSALLFGCGGDDEPGNQNPSGLYKNGTATLDGGNVVLGDLRGFVHGNRLIMFSIDGHLLFDGQIGAVTGSSYTATVNVYEDGAKTQSNVTVSGSVSSRSSLSGTFGSNGTGVASGNFNLSFDSAYNTAATRAKLLGTTSTDWDGDLLTTFSFAGETSNIDRIAVYADTDGDVILADVLDAGFTQECAFQGGFSIPNSNIAIYSITQDLPSLLNASCSLLNEVVTQYTGFAAVLSESVANSDLLYAITNGEYAVFGLVVKQVP